MKVNLLLAITLVLSGPFALAKSWKFDCGVQDGVQTTLAITPNHGEYPLQGIFKSVTTAKYIGDIDVERDEQGNMVNIFRLLDPTNFNSQLVAEYTERVGDSVWAQIVDTNTGDSKSYKCTLSHLEK